jgi:hypothetical protein
MELSVRLKTFLSSSNQLSIRSRIWVSTEQRRSRSGARQYGQVFAGYQLSSSAGAAWLDVAMANARGLDHAREAKRNSLPYVGPAKARVS